APRFFALVTTQLFFELLVGFFIVAADVDGLLRPFFCVVEIAAFGIARRQRAKDVGLFVIAKLRGLCTEFDRTFAVADGVVGRSGKHPGQIVEQSFVVGAKFQGCFIVGYGVGMIANVQVGISSAAKCREIFGIDRQRIGIRSDGFARLFIGG